MQVFTDSTTAVWYCNKQGGMWLWTLCQEGLSLCTKLEHSLAMFQSLAHIQLVGEIGR